MSFKILKEKILRNSHKYGLVGNFSFKNPLIFIIGALILVNATNLLAAQGPFDPIYSAITPLFEKMADTLQSKAYQLFFAIAALAQ